MLEAADENTLNEIRSEAQVMARLGMLSIVCCFVNGLPFFKLGNHPNIVSFIGAVTKVHQLDEIDHEKEKDKEGQEEQRSKKADGDVEEGDSVGKAMAVTKLCLVLEFCPRGSLYDFLIKRREKVFINN